MATIINTKNPRLPAAPLEYNKLFMDELERILGLYFNTIDNFTSNANLVLVAETAYIEAYDRTASIALTTTPTLLKPANTVTTGNGITYDATTGVFTFQYAGTYSISISLNIATTTANQFVYLYAQKNTGSGWVNNANSGKTYQLTNGQTVQFVSPQSVYRVAGEQTRYYIWATGSTSSLVTQILPTITPPVYVPAIRIQYS